MFLIYLLDGILRILIGKIFHKGVSMLQLVNVVLVILGLFLITGIQILLANYYARRFKWDYKFIMSLGLSISFIVVVLIIWAITKNVKYLTVGMICSILRNFNVC